MSAPVKRMYVFGAGVALGVAATRRTRRAKEAAAAAMKAKLTPSAIAADVADGMTHLYVDGPAPYTIRIGLVIDNPVDGEDDFFYPDVASHDVLVTNVAPTIALSQDPSVDEGSTYQLTLATSSIRAWTP